MGAKKGYFFIVVTILMFTSYEVVLKFISGQLNSMQLTLCRFSVGFLILLPLALHTLKRGESGWMARVWPTSPCWVSWASP